MKRIEVTTLVTVMLVAAIAPAACGDSTDRALLDGPTYAAGARDVLAARCARCHAGVAPAAGFRADSYRGAIGCLTDGRRASLPADAAPLALVLGREDHRGLVTADERDLLVRWVREGTVGVREGVHPRGFADPRSPTGHVATLRAARHRPLFDASDDNSCARCHEGAGPRPVGVTLSAPAATPCTTCHAEPQGVLACSTCHGAPGRAFPPRDACFFEADPRGDAHAAHASASNSRADALDCAACHPRPATGTFQGAHGDSHVEVWLADGARYDDRARACTGTCHDRGGARPTPTWTPGPPMGCNDCHASPPPAHYAGPCSSCHREADAAGTRLNAPRLHVNGRVDLGDGSQRCGACHGTGDDPWPKTGAHGAHAQPALAHAVACETCHPAPGPNHPVSAGAPNVRLAGLATKGGRRATYDPLTKSCAGTYCHEGGPPPRWNDGAAARACGSCHATPPAPPHAQSGSCAASGCHPNSAALGAAHVDGTIDR